MAPSVSAEAQLPEQPPEENPAADPAGGPPAQAFWWQCGLLALVIFALVCLGGVYADMKYLSHFDIGYLEYASLSDLLTGFVSFLRFALTPSFIIAFASLAALLAISITGFQYLVRLIRALARFASLGRPLAPAREAIREALSEQFRAGEGFWSSTRALVTRPYPALLIAAVASFVGLNVTVSAATRDLAEFADNFGDNARTDAASYEVVAVAGQGAAARWDQVVRLGRSSEFGFYYDLGARRAVVLPKGEIAEETASPAPLELTAEQATATAGGADERSTVDAATVEEPDSILVADASVALPADLTAAKPAAALATPSVVSGGSRALQTVAADNGGALGAGQLTTVAEASVEDQPSTQPALSPPALSATSGTDGLAAIEGNVLKSLDSLGELKDHIGHVENSFVKIREFANDLDSALSAIGQAFAELEKQLAKSDAALIRANCTEQSLSQPIRFEPQQADLSLASVGLLFQARREFVVDRSAEREEWLVVEAYADDGGGPAHQALAVQRGEAVRGFLQSELGIPSEILKVVVGSSTARGAADVRIFDCRERSPGIVASAPPQSELPLIRTASAAELPAEPSPRAAAVEHRDPVPEQLAMLSQELNPREGESGLLVAVPGHLLFETASEGIEPPARRLLDEIGELLSRQTGREALIIGHSDAFGDAGYNLDLSERRALAVRNYLLDHFDIGADRLRAVGRGEQDPIALNDTREGRIANRRIEVLIRD